MESKTKKAIALTLGGLVLIGGGAAIGSQLFPVTKTVTVEKTVTVPGPIQTVEVPGPVQVQTIEKPVEVKVDNGNLAAVEKYLYDNAGKADLLTNDLKENEIAQIANRVVFLNDATALAEDAARTEAAHQLHRESVTLSDNSTVLLRESDIERVRVQSDVGDINITDVDFDSSDADVIVPITFEQDGTKFKADLLVIIKDSKVDDVLLDSVSQR